MSRPRSAASVHSTEVKRHCAICRHMHLTDIMCYLNNDDDYYLFDLYLLIYDYWLTSLNVVTLFVSHAFIGPGLVDFNYLYLCVCFFKYSREQRHPPWKCVCYFFRIIQKKLIHNRGWICVVYGPAYGTVHYKEPLKSFEIWVGHSPGFGLPSVAILPWLCRKRRKAILIYI